MDCTACGKETSNPKFCSRSCAISTTNRKNPRRKRTNRCLGCGDLILSGWIRCSPCAKLAQESRDLGSQTLEQIQNQLNAKGKHPSWKNAVVRAHCRTANAFRAKECEICGYSNHVEMAHRVPLRDFPPSATLAEVNHPENVRILCRNHHWEFDNGMLSPRTGLAS